MIEHPKVFISYSHDSDEHKEWVLYLSTKLRNHGVDVIMDQWDLRLGSDLGFFMEQGLTKSHLVLCICTESYVTKSNNRGGGTGYEATIMNQPLLTNANSEHIICIVKNNPLEQKVPTILAGKLYIDFSNENNFHTNYEQLLYRIYNEDQSKKPKLGENPFSPNLARSIITSNNIKKDSYHNPKMNGIITFDISNNSGEYKIGIGKYEFITSWSRKGSDSIYAYNDKVLKIGYLEDCTSFPSASEFEKFDYTSRTRPLKLGELAILINQNNKFASIKVINIAGNILTFDYLIYDYL